MCPYLEICRGDLLLSGRRVRRGLLRLAAAAAAFHHCWRRGRGRGRLALVERVVVVQRGIRSRGAAAGSALNRRVLQQNSNIIILANQMRATPTGYRSK